MSPTPEEVRGLEFDFIAVDEDGHVALFATSGSGAFPAGASPGDPERELIEGLSTVGTAKQEGRGAGSCSEWIELGNRGVFVFDWKRPQGPYERVISPTEPVSVSSVPVPSDCAVTGCFARRPTIEWPRG